MKKMSQTINLLRRDGEDVRVYGHRGARGVLPENSIESFEYLAGIGIQAVEFDIQLSADGELVLMHDPLLPDYYVRDSAGVWLKAPGPKIMDIEFAELSGYDIGRSRPESAYSERYPEQQAIDGVRIPSLKMVFDWLRQHPEMLANIEVKSYANRDDWSAPPEVLAGSLGQLITQAELENEVVVSSFDWRVLHALKKEFPDVPRAYLTYFERPEPPMQPNIFSGSPWMGGLELPGDHESVVSLIAAEGGVAWCPFFADITAASLAAAHSAGLAVNVWTVNDVTDIARMRQLGVDGIITDYPERVLRK